MDTPILRQPRKILTLLFIALAVLLIKSPPHALADTSAVIGSQAPQINSSDISYAPNDSTVGTQVGGDRQPWFTVGTGGFNGQYSWAKVYVPNGAAATVTIINGNGVCDWQGNQKPTGDTSLDIAQNNSGPRVRYWLESLSDGSIAKANSEGVTNGNKGPGYKQALDNFDPTYPYPSSSAPQCKNLNFPKITTTQGIASSLKGHENYRVFLFVAKIINTDQTTSREKNFRLSISTSTGTGLIGLSRGISDNGGLLVDSATTFFAINQRDAPKIGPNGGNSANEVNWEYQYAPNCYEAVNGGSNAIKLHDADPGVFHPQRLRAKLLGGNKNAGLPTNVQNSWTDIQDSQGNTDFGPWGVSNSNASLPITASNLERYQFNLSGFNWQNTIQIRSPYDQFDAQSSIQCYSAICTASATQPSVPINTPDTVTVKLTNTSGAGLAFPDSFNVRQTLPVGSVSLQNTNNLKNGVTGTFTFNINARSSPQTVTFGYALYTDTLANGGFAIGADPLCHDDITWTSTLPVSCNSITLAHQAVPGQNYTNLYSVNVTASGSGTVTNYKVELDASPGAYLTPKNPPSQQQNIPSMSPGYNHNFKFDGSLDYRGTLNAKVLDSFGALVDPCPPIVVTPQVSPYFQVWQNDAAAGGGFMNVDACPQTYPDYVSPTTVTGPLWNAANSKYAGSIIANSSTSNPTDKQSISDFGAVALGLSPISSGNNIGFYTGFGTGSLRTWFANDIGGTTTQGYLNSVSSNHCTPDFTQTKKTIPSPQNTNSLLQAITNCPTDLTTNKASCQYDWIAGGNLDLPVGFVFPKHKQITIYVSGDITIDSDIVYEEPFDPNDTSDIPYFALITQGGNITLTNSVTQLDGLYVAQPTIGSLGKGIFATCDPGSSCSNQLVVNGAVIAQQVKPLRAHSAIEGSVPANIGNNPAEIFNFVPSMVLGAPAFEPFFQQNSTQGTYSVAPVF